MMMFSIIALGKKSLEVYGRRNRPN